MPEPEQSGILKSLHSRIRSFVLFRNCTGRTVDVFWVDYSGELVLYAVLKPTCLKMINTFATHPWVFKDTDTGERMQVQGRDFFMPPPYHRGQLNRIAVPITLPMRSLRSTSIWAISRLLHNDDEVQSLELPRSLIQDIQCVRRCTAESVESKRVRALENPEESEDAET